MKTIQWTEDDSGFISAGIDGTIMVWRLNADVLSAEKGKAVETNPIYKIKSKNGKCVNIAVKPDSKSVFYTVTDNQLIQEFENGKEKVRYEAGVSFSQLLPMIGSKTFFGGVSELGNKPGPIHVLKHPWEKLFEV